MNLMILIDGPSAAIVLGGTALATGLRAGRADIAITLAKLGQLGRRQFDPERARAELSLQVQAIRRDGLYRAPVRKFGDREIDAATDALIGHRSTAALIDVHERAKAGRLAQANRAVRTLALASEIAPAFGLVGTLVSLSQLPAGGLGRGAFTASISMAVITTLYGVLSANLLFAPLAKMVERAAAAEELARQQVIDWLAAQVADACPPRRAPRARADELETI